MANSFGQWFANLQFDQLFNFIEACFWLTIALMFLIQALRRTGRRALPYGTALAFAVFGVSDFIEMHTGAWYSPWPLLALKVGCVLAFVILLQIHIQQQRRRAEVRTDEPAERGA